MLPQIIKLIRPWQWVKNGVVFAGIIFSGNAFIREFQIKALLAAVAFCLLSSAVYALNDIVDRKIDRFHPMKKNRPLASGQLSIATAVVVVILFAAGALAISYSVNLDLFLVSAGYLILSVLYSLAFKNIVIIDVMSIAVGFVLRAEAGVVAIDAPFSSWLLIATFTLALFLALGKRRHELVSLEKGAVPHRKILEKYSSYLLDQLIGVVTASAVITYFFYTVSPSVQSKLHTPYMVLTTPFVVYGIFRYLYLVHQESKGGFPTRILFTDAPLLLNVLLWLASVIVLLYIV